MPMVLQMLFPPAKNADIFITLGKIYKILRKHKLELDENSFYNLPELLANPVMVFNSSEKSENSNAFVTVIELQGINGAPVLVPISLERKVSKTGDYYLASSVYTADKIVSINGQKTSTPNPEKLENWVSQGLLIYADTVKFKKWKKKNKVNF